MGGLKYLVVGSLEDGGMWIELRRVQGEVAGL